MKLYTLKREVLELNELLTGGFIAKIYQPLPRELVIKVRLATFGERRLVLSADPGLGRIHTTSLRIPNPPSPPRFCAYLRAHLQGVRIESIEAPIDDRVAVIKCLKGLKGSDEKSLLILELLGRDSNIMLVRAADGTIMDCLHRIYAKQEGLRSVLPGAIYSSPLPRQKQEMVSRGDILDGQGACKIPSAREIPNQISFRSSDETDVGSLDKALDAHYTIKLEGQILQAYRRTLQTPLRNKIRSLSNRLKKIEEDRNRLNRFAANQKYGELIKYNLKKIKKGMTSAVLFDWETNSTLNIPLDPSLTAVGNMEFYFSKSSKARRGFLIVEERLKITNDEIKALQDMDYMITEAESVQELEQSSELIIGLSRSRAFPKGEKLKRLPSVQAKPFFEYHSPGGHKILVGKSASGNDQILRKVADKNDLWLHAKDFAGAHVFLINSGESPIADADINFAAGLALKHSKGKNAGKGEVMLALLKDVSRVKGAHSGQVKVKTFRSVMADCSGSFGVGWPDQQS